MSGIVAFPTMGVQFVKGPALLLELATCGEIVVPTTTELDTIKGPPMGVENVVSKTLEKNVPDSVDVVSSISKFGQQVV